MKDNERCKYLKIVDNSQNFKYRENNLLQNMRRWKHF